MQTIHILGTAPSIREYVPNPDIKTIGVNDIFKYHAVDYLLLMDGVSTFADDRQKIIKESKPIKVYTTLTEWLKYFKNSALIKTFDEPGCIELFDDSAFTAYIKSVDSTFTAVHLAYKMGARKIIMYGVDFYGHALEIYHRLALICTYSDLYVELRTRGVELFVYYDTSLLVEAGVPFIKRNLPLGGYMERVRPLILDNKAPDKIADSEKKKYAKIWQKHVHYQSRNVLDFAKYVIAKTEFGYILELGCGTGEGAEYMRRKSRVVYGQDITLKGLKNLDNIDLYREKAAWDIPFYGDTFDYTVSTDLLEHIPPEKVEKTIAEIIRVTSKKTIHCISTEPDKQYCGHDVHLTVKPIEWWRSIFDMLNTKGIEIDIFDRPTLPKRITNLKL